MWEESRNLCSSTIWMRYNTDVKEFVYQFLIAGFYHPPPTDPTLPRSKVVLVTDWRVKVMNEVIAGMKAIKVYAWEYAFQSLITRIRRSASQQARLWSLLFHLSPPTPHCPSHLPPQQGE